MEQGMPGSIGDTATPMGLPALAKLVGLTAKGTLVDLAIGGSGEGHTVVLQFQYSSGSFTRLRAEYVIYIFHSKNLFRITKLTVTYLGPYSQYFIFIQLTNEPNKLKRYITL